MKLDSKQKQERIRHFIAEIKVNSNIAPFLATQDIPKYGIYDFCYINKNPSSFAKVQKKIKDSKYNQLSQFIEDLKQIFIAVSDYAFQTDPMQVVVEEIKQEIDRFAYKFVEEFKCHPPFTRPAPTTSRPVKDKVEAKPRPPLPIHLVDKPAMPSSDRPTNILQKLEMLFLLRANENNEPYVRSIGRIYEIGQQVGDEYVITLQNRNTSWMEFLNKHD